jgi:hypothetical protein
MRNHNAYNLADEGKGREVTYSSASSDYDAPRGSRAHARSSRDNADILGILDQETINRIQELGEINRQRRQMRINSRRRSAIMFSEMSELGGAFDSVQYLGSGSDVESFDAFSFKEPRQIVMNSSQLSIRLKICRYLSPSIDSTCLNLPGLR